MVWMDGGERLPYRGSSSSSSSEDAGGCFIGVLVLVGVILLINWFSKGAKEAPPATRPATQASSAG
jgi:hypothetical protein